jgi:hypothetical protein
MVAVRRILLCFLVLFASSTKLFSTPHSPLVRAGSDFSVFSENGKVGLKNNHGQVVIPATYDELGWSDGTFSVVNNITGYRKKDQWGLLNIDTKKVSKAEYVDISFGAGSLLIAHKKIAGSVKVKAGAINTSGKEVIPFLYDGLSISSFRAIVYDRSGNRFKKGLIDFENNILIPLNYQSIYPLGSLRYAVENFDNKTAIFSEDGKQITNFLIDSISSFKKNLAVIYQNQRQGVIDREGAIKLEALYREIKINDEGSVDVRQPDSWLMLDGENSITQQINADSIQSLSPNIFKMSVGGVFRLTNQKFEPVSEDVFTYIGTMENGTAIIRKNGREGLVDVNGKIILQPVYNRVMVDNNFILANATVDSRKRWIILDSGGKKISAQNYELILPFNGNFFPAKNRGSWGALDTSGKEVIACSYDSLIDQHNNNIVVKFKGKYGIINVKEKWIVTPQANRLRLINDSLYFERNSKTTFIKNFSGDIVYFTDNRIELHSDHFVEQLSNGSTWQVGLDGRISDRLDSPEEVQKVFSESEGYRAILKNGRYGFVDDRGRLRIANRYEAAKEFKQGLAAIMIRGKWGFISKEDKIAIQPVYDDVSSFANGYASVKFKGLFGLIDKNGKLILPIRYESIVVNSPSTFLIKQNGLWGLSDVNGRIIVHPKYDQLIDVGNGYIIAARQQKFGLLTLQGLSTIPMIYDGLSYDRHHDRFVALKKSGWEKIHTP